MYSIFCNQHQFIINPNAKIKNCKVYHDPIQEELVGIVERLLRIDGEEQIVLNGNEARLNTILTDAFELIEAAGGIVKNQDNEILLIHRLGYWDFPKGKCEPSETIEDTAIREVSEECGIDLQEIKIVQSLPSTYHFYRNPYTTNIALKTTHWFTMDYLGKRSLTPQKEEDIENAIWANMEQLGQYREQTYRSLKGLFDII